MRNSSNNRWRKASIDRLRAIWPKYPKAAILYEFPTRSWAAIQNKATKLGIRRARKWARVVAPTKHPLMEQLRDAREARNLTARHLSKMIGSCERYVSMAERGAMNPNLKMIDRWCVALNVRLKVEVVACR